MRGRRRTLCFNPLISGAELHMRPAPRPTPAGAPCFNPLISGAELHIEILVAIRLVHSLISFNPLISGAELHIPSGIFTSSGIFTPFQSPDKRGRTSHTQRPAASAAGGPRGSFNPLISGAELHIHGLSMAWAREEKIYEFQSPDKRGRTSHGGSNAIPATPTQEVFQSPDKRGRTSHVGSPSTGPRGSGWRFNPLISGAELHIFGALAKLPKEFGLFQSPDKRGRTSHSNPFKEPYHVLL